MDLENLVGVVAIPAPVENPQRPCVRAVQSRGPKGGRTYSVWKKAPEGLEYLLDSRLAPRRTV